MLLLDFKVIISNISLFAHVRETDTAGQSEEKPSTVTTYIQSSKHRKTQLSKHRKTQLSKHRKTQLSKHTNPVIQTHKNSVIQAHKNTLVQAHKSSYPSTQIQLSKHTKTQLSKHREKKNSHPSTEKRQRYVHVARLTEICTCCHIDRDMYMLPD